MDDALPQGYQVTIQRRNRWVWGWTVRVRNGGLMSPYVTDVGSAPSRRWAKRRAFRSARRHHGRRAWPPEVFRG